MSIYTVPYSTTYLSVLSFTINPTGTDSISLRLTLITLKSFDFKKSEFCNLAGKSYLDDVTLASYS